MRQRVSGLQSAHYLIKWLFRSKHAMKVACISPFNHLKCINGCVILIALRVSSVTLLYKLQNATYSGQMPAAKKIIEKLVLWFEFGSHGKFRHVKLLIKEKYPHTIITERYRFCCFKKIYSIVAIGN